MDDGTVALASRDFGEIPGQSRLLLLHGLLGSSRNWQGAGKRLAGHFSVTALDLRNHGASPHAPVMTYRLMAADLLRWLDANGWENCHLLGHSMGGKVAMQFACTHPRRVLSLTVVDIAPRAYPPRWQREFAVMRRMPVATLNSRTEAESWLEPEISDWAFRKFLVTNLERSAAGGFRWVVPLATLEAALPDLFQQVPCEGHQGYAGPTLFLRGEKSRFVDPQADELMMRRFFPQMQLETVAAAGHNVHFDQPEAFVDCLIRFIADKAV